MPAVSVIMLAWNSGEFLRPAIDSVLDQTMSDLELVIVDNGSTDGAIERALAERPDPRITVIRHAENVGIGAGTAAAVAQCRGRWIAIMDSDDRSHPMRLELQLRAAAADSSLDVISTDVDVIDRADAPAGAWPAFFVSEEIKQYATYNMPFCHPSMMARAEVLKAVPYRPEFNIVADFDFVARATERFKFGALSIKLYHYRRYADSTSFSRMVVSEAYACAVRLITARRRAGAAERVSETLAEAREVARTNPRLGSTYGHWAKRSQAEGFPLLAAFHASLEVRNAPGIFVGLRYIRYVIGAMRADRGSWRAALGGMAKGPFWMVLKRGGFPAFPRY